MKKIFIPLSLIFLTVSLLFSCKPRIEMDMAQWGDHALIDNVKIFTLNAADHQLQEYFTNGLVTPTLQRVYVSVGNAVVDAKAFTATMTIPATTDLTRLGIEFYHQGTKIDPLNGAPIAGIINDFTVKQYVYRIFSADGTTHDWTIIIK